jgi:hypothetical protein
VLDDLLYEAHQYDATQIASLGIPTSETVQHESKMQVLTEFLETKHIRDAKKPPYTFKHPRSTMNGKIKCQSIPTGTKGKDFSFTHTLLVDDTAIVANTCKELVERGEELYNHFKRLGVLPKNEHDFL